MISTNPYLVGKILDDALLATAITNLLFTDMLQLASTAMAGMV
ncbi:hypothetical protein [Aeromonas hydrophila]|nr:hypothetical protein [Aeromonas hydrophila]MCX4040023.1 hypothetical protein [Aeromonas hydrophila]MDM5119886.1 hypothetical protein [Aeromonas hydrophila]